MSDFVSIYWHWFIVIVSLISILGCGVLLWTQTTKRPAKGEVVKLHGNVWDEDLVEYNHPMPAWWMWLFYITIVFSLGYLIVYPGLGNFAGSFGWTSTNQFEEEVKKAESEFGPIFAKYVQVDIPTLAKDPAANEIGQRLFLNNCAQCHGSDAGGGKGFPNLRDADWLYGGDPNAIQTTLRAGRNGIMPPLGAAVGGEPGIKELTHYVRSLSGLKHDAVLAEAGKAKFAICGACHGPEGKGNQAVGAPNLTDKIWLYGSSEENIAEGIRLGRNNMMPAQLGRLGEAKVHLLAAYVYSLGGGVAPVPQATVAVIEAKPQVPPLTKVP
jgi:cytochrome c oxidase cbb3-type subunit III